MYHVGDRVKLKERTFFGIRFIDAETKGTVVDIEEGLMGSLTIEFDDVFDLYSVVPTEVDKIEEV